MQTRASRGSKALQAMKRIHLPARTADGVTIPGITGTTVPPNEIMTAITEEDNIPPSILTFATATTVVAESQKGKQGNSNPVRLRTIREGDREFMGEDPSDFEDEASENGFEVKTKK